jgi:hypothetical protein
MQKYTKMLNIFYQNLDFFFVEYGVEMSIFDQKRLKIRFFQNFGLSIVLVVKIVTEKWLEGKLCVLGDTSKRRRRTLRVFVHRELFQS